MSAISKPLSLLLALGMAACASAGSTADPPPAAAPDAPAATQPEAPATTTPEAAGGGHFSEAQADGGRDTFRALCTECHYSGEFSDAQFKFKWSRRSAEDLYDMIFTQMPESAPGSLSPEEAVSLVSYILRMNGFEAGANELAPDAEALSQISLRPIRN